MNKTPPKPDEDEPTHSKTQFELPKRDLQEDDLARLADYPDLEYLDLYSSKVQDHWLVHLKKVPHLRGINLGYTEISDAGLLFLEPSRDLFMVNLSGTKISDAGITHLLNFSELTMIELARTQITNSGLSQLNYLSKLDHLDLCHTKIDGMGLMLLKELPLLRNLYLSHTHIDDDALVKLQDFSNLKHLNLSHTKIGDTGIKHLQALSKLESLMIDHTSVSELGVRYLKDLPHLKSISLYDTKVSDNDVISLESLFPQCKFRPDSKTTEISNLGSKVIETVSESDWSQAKKCGDRLAQLVGEPNLQSVQEEINNNPAKAIDAIGEIGNWILICESRRDFETAAEFADVNIEFLKHDLIDSYRDDKIDDRFFKSDLEDLIDQYEIQAIRCFNMNEIERAKSMMREALFLSRKYHFPLDEGQQALVAEFEL